MKNFIMMLIFTTFSVCNVNAQTNDRIIQSVIVTKSMATKISNECLYGKGYALAVFYEANSKYITFSDIVQGKGRKILMSLEKYPKYSENFICKIYETWGYNGLKEIGFSDVEIIKCRKIIKKQKSK